MPRVRTNRGCIDQARSSAGFSLVEILLVVMVLLIIAAIAIPNLVHARMKANEAAASASLKTVETAQIMYANAYPEVGFSSSLTNLGTHGSNCENVGPKNACIIMDEQLTNGLKFGYIFELVGDGRSPSISYTVSATPESSGVSGRCAFSGSELGSITVVDATQGSGGKLSSGGPTGGCE